MENKGKKIIAGMMAGFSVLSTQSVLTSFQKLPMGGGCNLISYAEEGDSTNFVDFSVEATALDPKDYKGTLKYKIKFKDKTNNFAINTILRNTGVTKTDADEDGNTDVWAKDVTTSPLRIEGTANFFKAKAKGGSNLVEFKLTANCTDSSGAPQSQDLELNSTEYIETDNQGYQPEDTYQIINKDDVYSKLYWGADGGEDANKLIFEIPIELPEQVKVNGKDYNIDQFEVSTPYMNSEYIEEPPEQLDESNKSKGITYTLNGTDNTAKVTSADSSITEAIIPKNVKDTSGNTYAVTSIAAAVYNSGSNSYTGSFASCSNLKSVVIGNKVTSIGAQAFYNCGSLTSITIPEGVETIGGNAFRNCGSLTSITIPEGVETIGDSAFMDCTNLSLITIKSENLNNVGEYAFNGLPATGTIYVPASKVEEYKTLLGKTNVQSISE